MLEALPGLLEQGGQLALLGAGDPVLQEGFSPPPPNTRAKWVCRLATMRPSPTALWAAPTSFWSRAALNPCGLTQLYGLKYGTLPLVRRTGGLADTVADSSLENLADGLATGFVFEDSNALSLLRASVAPLSSRARRSGATCSVRR